MTARFLLPALCLLAAPFTSYAQKPRIIGGGDATAGQFPWMTALLNKDEPDTYLAQDCGGSLVHPYWIVTAAHCVEFRDPAKMQVVVGATNLKDAGLVRRNVAEVIMHPDYRPWGNDYDIALVLLTEPVTDIEPVEIISDPALAATGVQGLTLGWGSTSAAAPPVYPEALQSLELPILDTALVNQADWHNGGVTPNMFAAGFAEGGKDTCGGDSGGPFLIRGSAGQWLLAGVTNWGGDVCADAKKPGVYCRVSRYRQWIQSIIWPNFHQWETAAGISTDDGPDVDGDGASQWLEYALRRDPREADNGLMYPGFTMFESLRHATLSVKRAAGGGDITWLLQGSVDLASWTTLNSELQLTGPPQDIPNDPASELVTWRGLPEQDGRSFLRTTIKPGGKFQTHARTLKYPGYAQHALHTLEQPTGGFYTRDYTLGGLEPVQGQSVIMTLRSDSMDVVLKLLDASGTELAIANTDNAGGTDEKITFTPMAGVTYTAQVTTRSAGETGAYQLALFTIPSGTPTLSFGGSRNGRLDDFDPTDDFYQEDLHYKDDYLFLPSTAAMVSMSLRAPAIDPSLSIIDAETGASMRLADAFPGFGAALITWKPQPGHYYFVRASSYYPEQTGTYTLRAQAPSVAEAGETIFEGDLSTTDGLHTVTDSDTGEQTYHLADDYEITGLTPGVRYYLDVVSEDFNGFATAHDAETDEDVTDIDSLDNLFFEPEAGKSYYLRVFSIEEEVTGTYLFRISDQ